jgi:aspartate ammonia-lyase
MRMRRESDSLGEVALPVEALYGPHTARAIDNFDLAGRPVHPALLAAFGEVKRAAAHTNRALGCWADHPERFAAIDQACAELAAGGLRSWLAVDALQGGAGTSTNMAVNEVLANRALAILGLPLGAFDSISPTDDLNLHQSTNDTFPTALRIAAIRGVRALDAALVRLQESLQEQERRHEGVVRVARTQLQDAVLTTMGRSFGAWAQAVERDRWRVYKCEERLRVVNLGGTAIGTGLGAPRVYVFRVVDTLREQTGLGLARADQLQEATQNADAFVEVSGILKASAASLIKICGDLRLLASGPEAGLGELRLPPRQAGSSIMPGKVNPVIPEAVTQAAMRVIAHDAAITHACAAGSLELNPFLPLVADSLLDSLDLLSRACHSLADRCIDGIEVNAERCAALVHGSTAFATALLPALGYDAVSALVLRAQAEGRSVREQVLGDGLLDEAQLDELTSPEAVCRLGHPGPVRRKGGEGT